MNSSDSTIKIQICDTVNPSVVQVYGYTYLHFYFCYVFVSIFSTSKNHRVFILISAYSSISILPFCNLALRARTKQGLWSPCPQVGALLILLEETRYNKYILSITRYLIWSLGPKAHCSPLGQIGLSFVRIVNANAIPRVAAARWSGAFPRGAQLGSCRTVKRSKSKVKTSEVCKDFIWLHRAC